MPYNNHELQKSNPSDDELNPLSNPLLAAHLGRWAEVYFTNRPEHRDRAVLDLVRELEVESGGAAATRQQLQETPALERSQESLPSNQTASQDANESGILCASCGYFNSDTHSYCGMCGDALTAALGADPEKRRFAEPERAIAEDTTGYGYPEDEWQRRSPGPIEDEDAFSDSASSFDDSDLPHFARQSEAVPHRARLYVGLILAIFLGGLIYVARRGTAFFDGQHSPDSKVMPAAQPAPEAQAPENQEGAPPSPVERKETKEPPAQAQAVAELQPKEDLQTARALPNESVRPTRQANSPTPPQRAVSAGQTGRNELAEAQRGLGADRRNAREAVPLLWSAVAKGNGPAMVALSDLYLRGDGVAQNCDQARVLLDSAAKKGAKGAGERLRHLQAFGCR